MSGKTLAVILYGRHVANLEQTAGGSHTLTYIGPSTSPISLSMPVATATYKHGKVRPFLEGLLPDREDTRQAMGRQFGVAGRNPFALLEHIGLDCAGAVQFCPLSDVADVLARKGDLDPVDEAELGRRLRLLRADPAASWRAPRERWSLGGAQAKFAIRQEGGAWFEATGAEPTSHIVKPGVDGFRHQALNEHVCLDAAARLGLRAARSEFTEFDGEPALVVDRYDRRRSTSGELLRAHQEDMCQALSVRPADKYETEGGPRAVDIVQLLRRNVDAGNRERYIDEFVSYLAYNYLIAAPDAHAKNYSVLLLAGQVRLAPIYDTASGAPYDTQAQSGLRSAAMSIGGAREFGYVRREHWEKFAAEAGVDAEHVVGRVRTLAGQVPDALSDAFASMGATEDAVDLRERMLGKIAHLCATTVAQFDREDRTVAHGPASTSAAGGRRRRVPAGAHEGGQFTVARSEPDVTLGD